MDEVHPILNDLLQSMNKISSLPSDFEGKKKIKHWLELTNEMRASDELDEDQTRQCLFDLEQAHSAFYRSLSA